MDTESALMFIIIASAFLFFNIFAWVRAIDDLCDIRYRQLTNNIDTLSGIILSQEKRIEEILHSDKFCDKPLLWGDIEHHIEKKAEDI